MPERTCSLPDCDRPHRARGLCATHYNQRDPNRYRKVPMQCDHCGATVMKARTSKYQHRFCSSACQAEFFFGPDRIPSTERRQLRRLSKVSAAQRRLERAAAGVTGTATWRVGPCRECGMVFTFNQPHAETCSERCKRRMHRRRAKARRRMRMRTAPHEVIDPRVVFARDGWRCALCGQATRRKAVVPHPKAPTIDHVVPVSEGGSHTYANVQCAHFACNCAKNANSLGPEQLRLIG